VSEEQYPGQAAEAEQDYQDSLVIPDGGPAFPHTLPTGQPFSGMSLRDYFAAQALTGCLAYSVVNPMIGNFHENATPDNVAAAVYNYADAMLKARDSK